MITAIDTNVIVALWNSDKELNQTARDALELAFERGGLVICGAVFGELLASPGRTEAFIEEFLAENRITVDWITDESTWRDAGRAFSEYAHRRRKQKSGLPRRILTDFLIGAHAFNRRCELLTLDEGIYRAAFPKLRIVRI
jgi:predicted nucleic acid-binding protein